MPLRTYDEDNVGPSELSSALEGYSLEVTAKDAKSLREVSDEIPPKTAISVTFLPGEEMEARVAAARLVRSLGFEPVPHISARRLRSSEELKEYLMRLHEAAAINRVFAIAGDLSAPLGPYDDALAIIQSAELLESHMSFPVLGYYRSQHENQSWVAALTTILDTSAVLIAGVDGTHGYQARLTFAMARHAAVDLAMTFKTPPPAAARLTESELERLQESLRAAGLELRDGPTVAKAITDLCGLYEPFVRALSSYYGFALPPFLPPTAPVDNWQTSAWMQRSPGLGGLPAASTGESHFD